MTQVTDFTSTGDIRLDRAVIEQIPALSRAQARRLIEAGSVTVDGQPVLKPGVNVSPGAIVRVAGGGTRSGDMNGLEADICRLEHPAAARTNKTRSANIARREFG